VSAATRRGNRESWIPDEPNARGYYEASVWMGAKPDGRPDRRHIERKSKAARNRRVRELERLRDAGFTGRPGTVPTVEQMMTRRLTVVLPQRGRAPRTIDDYWSKARNDIFPRWGGQRIDRMLPEYLEDGYAEMLAEGHAASHVRKVHAILASAYEDEVRRGNVARNPCRLVEPPALGLRDVPALTQGQARVILAVAAGRRNAARWLIGLACGLRQGEAIGLRWRYVDLDRGELRVWYQLQRLTWRHGCTAPCGRPARSCSRRHGGGLVFREIKERRRKTVRLAPELVAVLRGHRMVQDAERELAANVWEEHDLVFCQPNGRPIGPRADWQEWAGILADAGIPHQGVHAMRHSAATIALTEGVALAVVQEMLGHADIRVTRGYTHVPGPLAEDASVRVVRAIYGPSGGPSEPGSATKTDTRQP
jgi:integrase